MRVFVLGTGRCGTQTFVRACEHFDNFTAGHETRRTELGPDRVEYPDGHIEADNRLSWLLGELAQRYDGGEVLYVHLRRNVDEVVASFRQRWDSSFRASIIRAFAHGIMIQTADWPEEQVDDVCRYYVDVVTSNIRTFLAERRSVELWLHELPATFPDFMSAIGANGPMADIRRELTIRHNAGR